ncbi:putative ribosomal protein s21 protein [Rosellinia necatrix]|uniref:Putative ribosomal protein s21 protein n=1 Tax=Rosellinia necatrix TaxID=77044 RepID=A0A1S8A5T2_ROSNE|nr:putative ribosomal protein s21 protein [Rosellinia necatrix]
MYAPRNSQTTLRPLTHHIPRLADLTFPGRAELGRAAQAAIRSTSLLRAAPIRPQSYRHIALGGTVSGRHHMSTSPDRRSPDQTARPTPVPISLSKTQQQHHHHHHQQQQQPSRSASNWASPGARASGGLGNIAGLSPRKLRSSSYDLAFGGAKQSEEETRAREGSDDDSLSIEIADIQPNRHPKIEPPVAPRAQLRLVPRTGRTVYVRHNVDVARSFKLLAIQVAQNGVRRDAKAQRFHERPGAKRKRLKSQRWQKRFNFGFKATIARVRQLTAQGW